MYRLTVTFNLYESN